MKSSSLDPTARAVSALGDLYTKDAKLATVLATPTLTDADKSAILVELQKSIGAAGATQLSPTSPVTPVSAIAYGAGLGAPLAPTPNVLGPKRKRESMSSPGSTGAARASALNGGRLTPGCSIGGAVAKCWSSW